MNPARFPDDVVVALHDSGVTVTCLPVQLDEGDWQAAFFFVVPLGSPALEPGALDTGPFAVQFEVDLFEHEKGTVLELDIEIRVPGNPLAGTLLFLTGHASAHFEALRLLGAQEQVPLFIGDPYCQVISQQRVPLSYAHRDGFRSLVDEAVRLDAVIRLSGHYDAEAAFTAATERQQGRV